jgi:type I restriction enzyme, S subunit
VTKGLDHEVPMKDSAVTWIGEIPEHWEEKPLKSVTPDDRPIMYGIVLPGPNVEDGVPIVKGGDVAPGRLRLDLRNKTTREIESRYIRSRLLGGDLVYAIRGSIGMVEVVPEEVEGANLTQDAARISPGPAVLGRWLLYALKSRASFAQLDAGAAGATIRGINIRDLKRTMVQVPPLTEQGDIADYLDEEAKKIDGLLDKVRHHIEKLREYRTALTFAAVTGKIDVRGELDS